jgi:hypothetical protein
MYFVRRITTYVRCSISVQHKLTPASVFHRIAITPLVPAAL